MMNRDYGIRFSDEQYLSKEEIKKTLNLTSNDYIWESVLKYRSLYMNILDLFSTNKKPYNYCLTNGIVNNIIKLEKKFNKLELLSIKYDLNDVTNYFKCEIVSILSIINSFNDISSSLIESLVKKEITNIPQKYLILDNYLLCLDFIKNTSATKLDENVIKRIYSILLHGVSEDFNNISIYRTYNINDTDENASYVDSADCNQLESMMSYFYEFVQNSNTFSIVKSAFAFYYIYYLKPFELFNEEMALLISKYILNNDDNDVSYYPIEKLILSLQSNELKKIFIECQTSFDLTYFLVKFIDIFNDSINEIDNYYNNIHNKLIKNEVLVEDIINDNEEIKENIPQENKLTFEVKRNIINDEHHSSINYKQNVSLPIIPSGLDEIDASEIAEHLLELHPTLKKGQAEFYARHCTVGKYYTIQQYKEFNDVAYETARTSMDNLAFLDFYKKEKIRNKFVYTPVIREND